MKKIIPLAVAAVFALTSGFTMAATPAKAVSPQAVQTKVVKKQHHQTKHHAKAPAVKVAPATK
ncbi:MULTISPECIES: hypothetical protein [Aeromonas]|uniref:hypothetical protein n=1 Tax=Aeromonas TaxID=642 RepID=UPI000C76B1D1|nr:hypothetical protein [Aeromonas veronii]AYK18017.1 hypothetical protein C0073_009130 [Aeromonas veronii]MCR3965300.1 hypothetical protein [Aeromonas veronii]PNW65723.1 hypothetical protein C2U29_20245 [Aeromonas veronii]